MKPRMFLLFVAVVGLVWFIAGCGKSEAGAGTKVVKYHCPMHPTYTSDRPGDCPICGMKLVPIKEDAAAASASPQATHTEPAVPGRVSVMISAEKRQLIGVTTTTVVFRELTRTFRAPATLTHDETRLARITPRFGGFVRKLQVNFTGQPVEKGQALFTAYSPEVLAAENDYLVAWRNFQNLANASADTRESGQRLLDGARRRLTLLEISDEQLRALVQRGKSDDELEFRAPVTGHVISKSAIEGKAFTAGEALYEIGVLHRLWVRAAIPEPELSLVRTGQTARVVFPSLQNRTIEASVGFVSPHADPQTRRGEARLEIANDLGDLKPEMWAEVEFALPLGRVLTVPASAVIDTGARRLVFVDGEGEHIQPREVEIGAHAEDWWEVKAGVKEGERVVSRALFLVDSESQLKAAIAGMGAGEHQH